MKPKRRFIAVIVAAARSETTRLPFERGAPRAAMIARRDTHKPPPKARAAARA